MKCACKQIYRGNMPVTELYAFNLTCVILLMALYGVALKYKKTDILCLENRFGECDICSRLPIISVRTNDAIISLSMNP